MNHETDPDPNSKPGKKWLDGAEAEGEAVIARTNAYGDVTMYRIHVEKVNRFEQDNE